jgi:hypothetical protein
MLGACAPRQGTAALLRCKKDMGKPLLSIFEIAYRSNIEF